MTATGMLTMGPDRAVGGFNGQVSPLRGEQADRGLAGQGAGEQAFAALMAGLEGHLSPSGEASHGDPGSSADGVPAEVNAGLGLAQLLAQAALGVSPAPVQPMGAQLSAEPAPAGIASGGAAAPLPEPQTVSAMVVLRNEAHFAPTTEPSAPAGLMPVSAADATPAADTDAGAGSGRSGLAGSEGRLQRPEPVEASATDVPKDQLTPVMGTSVGRQIADKIAGSLEDLDRALPIERSAAALNQTPSPAAHVQPALRVLHIALQPVDLGMVVVRMSLRGDAMSLHLEAAADDTARRLAHDREELVRVLASSGYTLDDLVIETVASDVWAKATPTSSEQPGPTQQVSARSEQTASWTATDARPRGSQQGEGQRAPQVDRVADDLSEEARVSVGLFV